MPTAVVCTTIGPYHKSLSLQKDWTLPSLSPSEARVRVLAAGLAFPDVLVVEGKHVQQKEPPFVPASEICGVVTERGSSCSLRPGEIIFGTCEGALCEETVVSEEDVHRCPAGVDPHVAAGFELNYGTTYHVLVDVGGLKDGETLLVLGASGGVGMAAVDLGRALGARVVACASTREKLRECANAGAEVLVDYSENFKGRLKEAGVYGEVDVVYDPVGGGWSEVAIRAMNWGGRHVVVGFASGGATPKSAIPKIPLNLALLNERKILGCFWGPWKMQHPERNRKNIKKMMDMVASGKLNPVISKRYNFSNYMQAFRDMMSRKVIGKITIEPVMANGGISSNL